jgi:tetratricopeptide (TPR) repeat protein/predicted Ser/Thr protein kinase
MTTPASPTTIGRYRILGLLGEGGMGAVYRAEQDQPSRIVALKVVRPDLVSPRLVRRFARETEVLGRLQHPGIAQIYEAGTAEGPEGPQPFFAMELVAGVPLDEYTRGKGLTVTQRLELFARICDAVHYAHQKGVIHRDLKPSNILVDDAGQPKVLDFGVARIADEDSENTRQTTMGQLLGTLQYMSPEQINADPLDIDIRSDVYSLGVILYQLLAEQLPYDISRHGLHEAAWVILQVDPAPLSSVNRTLRGDVETIVGKALEKEKARRYSSADELASDIRRYLKHEPISARPASAGYQIRKFAERNKALVGGLTLAAAILVVGAVVSIMLAVRATAAERLAETRRAEAEASGRLAEQRRAEATAALLAADSARAVAQQEQRAAEASAAVATREADRATSVNAVLQDLLRSPDPERSLGEKLTVRELLDQVSANPERYNRNAVPDVQAAVDQSLGRAYLSLALFPEARRHFDSAYAIRRRVLGPHALELASSAEDRAALSKQLGDYPAAERYYREGLAIRRRLGGTDDDPISRAVSDLGFVRYSRGDHAGAERLYRESLRLAMRRHGRRGAEVAVQQHALGQFLLWTRRPKEALPLLEASLAGKRELYGDVHPSVLISRNTLASARKNAGDFTGATALYRESLRQALKLYGDEHTSTASIKMELAECLVGVRRLEEADTLMLAAMATRERLLGEQHADVSLGRTQMARLRMEQRNFTGADSLFRLALAGRRALLGDSSPSVASSLNDLGYSAQLQGRWADAEPYHRQALAIFSAKGLVREETDAIAQLGWVLSKGPRLAEADSLLRLALQRRLSEYGEGSLPVGDAYEKLTGIAVARNDLPRAESLAAAGLEVRRKMYGPQTPQVAGQLLNIAFLRERMNDSSGAVPALREALAITSAVRPATDANVIFHQQWLAQDLCTTGRAEEGEGLLRSAMANAGTDTTRSMPWRLRVALGYCLAKQGKFEEAEPLMLEGERRVRTIPNITKEIRGAAILRLAQLYQLWGNQPREAEWRARLGSN